MKKRKILSVFLLVMGFSMMQTLFINNVSASYDSIMMTRENTVIIVQEGTSTPDNLNPWIWNPNFGVALIYEPLFGKDISNDEFTLGIGTAKTWNADGSFITVNLNPSAKWSDGEAINADDVIFSYNISFEQGWIDDIDQKISSIERINDYTVRFHATPEFNHSAMIVEWLSTDRPILPEHIWTEINDTESVGNGYLGNFANNWFDPSYPEEWKVSSGPYVPFGKDGDSQIYKLRDDWWGLNEIYTDLPNFALHPEAQYVKIISPIENLKDTNEIINTDFDFLVGSTDTDWRNILNQNEKLMTYYQRDLDKLFGGFGSTIELAFNHDRYPFNELWFREVIAYALDYDTISENAYDNIYPRSKQGVLNSELGINEDIYDPIVQATNGIDFDQTQALSILAANCYYNSSEQAWYTLNSTEFLGMEGVIDMDPDVDEVNVKLGGYDIITPIGWTDVERGVDEWVTCINAIDISVEKNLTVFGNLMEPNYEYEENLSDDTFDMAMIVFGGLLRDNPAKLFNYYTGDSTTWRNCTNWINPTYADYAHEFEIADNQADRETYAFLLQEILATEMPSIPTHTTVTNCLYNSEYWDGWVTDDNLYDTPTTALQLRTSIADKVRQILNLKKATTITNGIWQDIFENGNLVECIDEEERNRFNIDCTISDSVSVKLTAMTGYNNIPIPEKMAVLSVYEIEFSNPEVVSDIDGTFTIYSDSYGPLKLYKVLEWDGTELTEIAESELTENDNTITVNNINPENIYLVAEIANENADVPFDIPGYSTIFLFSLLTLTSIGIIYRLRKET